MATPYSDVINSFLGKITDYELPLLETDRDSIVISYMHSANSKFKRICLVDLTDVDEDLKQFNQDLDDEIIDIITETMIVEWLKPKLYSLENLRNVLNTKDFTQFSPANLLDKIQATYKEAKLESKRMMNNYSHYHGKVDEITQ
ncbi:MAG: hypothetical protein WCR38_04825 [Bacteroidales bacterium]